MRARRVGSWWSTVGAAWALAAVVVVAAFALDRVGVSVSDDVTAATTPREVQLRESALYDCLRTVPPHQRLDSAFAACGLEYERTSRSEPGGAP